ncbi:TetR/AcrR family transcriptional regulator [Christiangramia sp. OXR-203]|uniref:TetR/AcrR family transcriptional regulator n=1 Tax=Christiangramia sp. OXR-203 TaxID=3100176 RepID=UPI002AC90FCC|nr:TetR/AcrR family transcriptional regulator [Christiangramia sp. OXR-203]WPY98220.1 TetR/AcrR family transcriptional regulator [Christiangramia sp. OXR-203]|tara:strand:- start:187 stop:777 length:591 start_codon:yes stop_codon:yes gene_type:complete
MSKQYIQKGRKTQKLKTRDKILRSTQKLLEKNQDISLEDVAKEAGISRATIYRYYSSIDVLAAEAVLDLNTKSSEDLYDEVAGKDLKEAILSMQNYYNQLTIDNESGFRKYMSVVLNNDHSDKMRGARRKKSLLMLLENKAQHMSAQDKENLANITTVLMGIEAFVVTKDVCGLNNVESKNLLNWGMEKLLESILK